MANKKLNNEEIRKLLQQMDCEDKNSYDNQIDFFVTANEQNIHDKNLSETENIYCEDNNSELIQSGELSEEENVYFR